MRWVMIALVMAMVVPAAAEYTPPSGPPCQSVPCGLGAGPAGQLAGMAGVGFDAEYMVQMFRQNADIAALAEWGTPGSLTRTCGGSRRRYTPNEAI